MLKFLLCVDFYIEDDSKDFPSDFINSKNRLISSIFENFKENKFSLELISSNKKSSPVSLSFNSRIQDFSFEEVVFLSEDLAELFFLLKVDLIDHRKNIFYVWDTIQKSTAAGFAVSVLGPNDSVNGEAMLAQQGFDDGEMDTGFLTLDDEAEAIVHVGDLPKLVQLALGS